MKKQLILFLILALPLLCMAGSKDLIQLRNLYYKASKDRHEAEKFSQATGNAPGIDRTLLSGYSGMAWMIKANHSFNPYNKLSYFLKGKKLLDEAIANAPANAELRFLRYCVQTNAPGFLGYSSNIKGDKAEILRNYPSLQDADLKKRIREYMLTSSDCKAEERKIFDSI